MLPKRLLDQRFPTDRVVVKDDAITANIKGQVPTALGEKNRWLVERVGVADLIVDILVRCRDFRDHYFCVFDLPLNILEDDARPIYLVDPNDINTQLLRLG